MKRKLALLLVTVMTLALLPTSTLLASSVNVLTGFTGNISEKTVFVEANLLPNYVDAGPNSTFSGGTNSSTGTEIYVYGNLSNSTLKISNNDNVKYVQSAPYLRIEPKSTIVAGSGIELSLDGAEWFFVDSSDSKWNPSHGNATVDISSMYQLKIRDSSGNFPFATLYNLYDYFINARWNSGGTATPGGLHLNQPDSMTDAQFLDSLKGTVLIQNDGNSPGMHVRSQALQVIGSGSYSAFNLEKTYRERLYDSETTSSVPSGTRMASVSNGVYRRYAAGNAANYGKIIYEMTFSADKRKAYVKFPETISVGNVADFADPFANSLDGSNYIYIPMIIRTTASSGDTVLTINGNNTSISNSTYVISGGGSGSTSNGGSDSGSESSGSNNSGGNNSGGNNSGTISGEPTSGLTNTSENQEKIESLLESGQAVEITLSAEDDSVTLNTATVEALVSAGEALVIKQGGLTLTIAPQTLEQLERLADNSGNFEINIAPLTNEMVAALLEAAMQAGSGDVTLAAGVLDINILVGGNAVKEFDTPLQINIDITSSDLAKGQIEKLSGVRLNNDGTISRLGGAYDANTKQFNFFTSRTSLYSVMFVEDLVSLFLTLDSSSYTLNDSKRSFDVVPIIYRNYTKSAAQQKRFQ